MKKSEINQLLSELTGSSAFKSAELAVNIEKKFDQLIKKKIQKQMSMDTDPDKDKAGDV